MLTSFGSDPELMIVNEKGEYVSAISVVPGCKKNKVDLGNGNYAFYDNVLAEMNIKPSFSRNEVCENFRDCFHRLAKLIGNLRLLPQASQVYPESECAHKDAKVFGCDPEYSIYRTNYRGKMLKLKPPICKDTFRSGGGHVHIGSPLAKKKGTFLDVLRMCDVFLGAISILIDHDSTSLARRRLYGGAGTNRPCAAYGVEYRAMSNFWVASPKTVLLIYDLTDLLISTVASGKASEIWSKIDPESLKGWINGGNKNGILENIFPLVVTEMSSDLRSRVESMMSPQNFDFYREWNL